MLGLLTLWSPVISSDRDELDSTVAMNVGASQFLRRTGHPYDLVRTLSKTCGRSLKRAAARLTV